MVKLEDVLLVLEQDTLIDIRVRMAKTLIKAMIEQEAAIKEQEQQHENT